MSKAENKGTIIGNRCTFQHRRKINPMKYRKLLGEKMEIFTEVIIQNLSYCDYELKEISLVKPCLTPTKRKNKPEVAMNEATMKRKHRY